MPTPPRCPVRCPGECTGSIPVPRADTTLAWTKVPGLARRLRATAGHDTLVLKPGREHLLPESRRS